MDSTTVTRLRNLILSMTWVLWAHPVLAEDILLWAVFHRNMYTVSKLIISNPQIQYDVGLLKQSYALIFI